MEKMANDVSTITFGLDEFLSIGQSIESNVGGDEGMWLCRGQDHF